MSENVTAARTIRASISGPAWHGPAVLETLDGVTAAQAASRPLWDAHTIWELLHHITAWQEYALFALEGKTRDKLPARGDWPPVEDTSPAAWDHAVAEFRAIGERLVALVENFDDVRLRENVPGRDFPIKVMLHGVAHHNCYHGGQMALLKKAIRQTLVPNSCHVAACR